MSGKARGHRASSSRVVPAIPLALGGARKQSVEKNDLKTSERSDVAHKLRYNTTSASSSSDQHNVKPLHDEQSAKAGRHYRDTGKEQGGSILFANSPADVSDNSKAPNGTAPGLLHDSHSLTISSSPENSEGLIPSTGRRRQSSDLPMSSGQRESENQSSVQPRETSISQHSHSSVPAHLHASLLVPENNHHDHMPSAGPSLQPRVSSVNGGTSHGDRPTRSEQESVGISFYSQPQEAHHPSKYNENNNSEYQHSQQMFLRGSVGDIHLPALTPVHGSKGHINVNHAAPHNPPNAAIIEGSHHSNMLSSLPDTGGNLHHHSYSAALRQVPSSPDPSSFFMIAPYLHDHFGNPELADCMLHFSHSDGNFPSFELAGHALFFSRSPQLRALLRPQSATQVDSFIQPQKISISITDRFLVNNMALEKALRRFYAGDLPDIHFPSGVLGYKSIVDCMNFALSYTAAGHFLQSDEVASCGLDLVSDYLHFETIGKALAFGLDGGIGYSWYPRGGLDDDHVSSASSSEEAPFKPDSSAGYPTYGIYSDRLLSVILGFITQYLVVEWTFDARAPELSDCLRLPAIGSGQHTRSSSLLTQIRFGDMTLSDQDADAYNRGRTISSVLLTLPYPLLKHLLEHEVFATKLGQERATDLAQAVVEERERRRKAISQQSEQREQSTAVEEGQWRCLRWAETVEKSQQYPCGFRLTRHHLGMETPTSGKS